MKRLLAWSLCAALLLTGCATGHRTIGSGASVTKKKVTAKKKSSGSPLDLYKKATNPKKVAVRKKAKPKKTAVGDWKARYDRPDGRFRTNYFSR